MPGSARQIKRRYTPLTKPFDCPSSPDPIIGDEGGGGRLRLLLVTQPPFDSVAGGTREGVRNRFRQFLLMLPRCLMEEAYLPAITPAPFAHEHMKPKTRAHGRGQ